MKNLTLKMLGFALFICCAIPLQASYFIKNNGQLKNADGTPANDVLFYGQTGGGKTVYIQADRISFVWANNVQTTGSIAEVKRTGDLSKLPKTTATLKRMDLLFNVANPEQVVVPLPSIQPTNHVFDLSGVTYHATQHNSIVINEIRHGYDAELNFVDGNLKLKLSSTNTEEFFSDNQFDLTVLGGQLTENGEDLFFINAGSNELELRVKGAIRDENGTLSYIGLNADVEEGLQWVIDKANGNLTLELDFIDPNVIVPSEEELEQSIENTVDLDWATYLGGIGNDEVTDMEVDAAGNLYICGTTTHGSYPQTFNLIEEEVISQKSFITKFNVQRAVEFSLLYGGDSPFDGANGLAVDEFGNVYFVGTTLSSNLPVMSNGIQWRLTNGNTIASGYIARINANGIRDWSTYFGTAQDNNGNSTGTTIVTACDYRNGQFVVVARAGNTSPSEFDFPYVTPHSSAFLETGSNMTINQLQGNTLGFSLIASFDPQQRLEWSTLYGLFGSTIYDVELTSSDRLSLSHHNDVYVVLNQNSEIETQNISTNCQGGGQTWLPLCQSTNGAYFDATLDGDLDVVLAKFGTDFSLDWATFIGGSGSDILYDNCLTEMPDGSNNGVPSSKIAVTFSTHSTDLSTQNGSQRYFQPNFAGNADAFIMEFENHNQRYGSYFGGADFDQPTNLTYGTKLGYDQFGTLTTFSYPVLCGATKSAQNFANNQSSNVGFYDGQLNENGGSSKSDAFFAELITNDLSGASVYSTYYGYEDNESAIGVNYGPLNAAGERIVDIVGRCDGPNFELLNRANAYNQSYAGAEDATVTQLTMVQEQDLTPPNSFKNGVISKVNEPSRWVVYPTLVHNSITIESKTEKDSKTHVRIIDNSGSVVNMQNIDVSQGTHSIDVSTLSKGNYHIVLDQAGQAQSFSFIKN